VEAEDQPMKHRITFDTYCPVVSSRRAEARKGGGK
jgi:hypothetical protein